MEDIPKGHEHTAREQMYEGRKHLCQERGLR